MTEGSPPAHENQASNACLWLILALAIAAVTHDALSQASWFEGFVRDLGHWILHPATSLGSWRPRRPPWSELAIGAVFLVVGSGTSVLLLRGTRLEGDRAALLGLTPIMTISSAGFAATFLLTFGHVSLAWLLGVLVLFLAALVILALRCGGAPRLLSVYSHERTTSANTPVRSTRLQQIGRWSTSCVLGTTLLLITLRDLISPVVEWDATIYHSQLARLWFLQRPDPPLLFGPSLGVQISANYPPLFPASGLAANLSAGRVTDVVLRLESPLLLIGMLLFVFAFSRRRFGLTAAWWSVFLLGTAPLMVLYASWSTSYVLTSALGLIAILLCVEAAAQDTRSRRLWVVVGLLLGLAILSSFYGWLYLLVALPAVLAVRASRKERIANALWMLATVAAVSGVWLLRNWIELGDPLYPLGIPLFHGRGLSGPLWSAAQQELRVNANSYWIGSHSLLRLRQLATLLFDRHLVAIGSLPVALMLWRRNFSRLEKRYVALAALVLLGAELVPGWFWIRALLPAVPFLAIGGGVALSELGLRARRRRDAPSAIRGRLSSWSSTIFRVSALSLFLAVSLIGGAIALALAIAGPGQGTWTTQLPNSTNFMALNQSLGSASSTLWTVFGGDYEAWNWLNEHLRGERLATFEIRAEYLNHPGTILYLDGEEAKPLLTIMTPSRALDFFKHHHVRYIFVPAWSAGPGATRDPAVNLLPLHNFLGDADFPLVASFAPSVSFPLSNIYQVGGRVTGVQSAIFPGPSSPSPGAGGPYYFASESYDGWIFSPVSSHASETLKITYFDSSRENISFSAYISGGTWDLDFSSLELRGTKRWRSVTVPLPDSSTGITAVNINVGRGSLEVKSAVVIPKK